MNRSPDLDEDVAPPRACLVLHGLGGGPYEARPLIDALRQAGLTVEAPVYPGHTGPGPHMPRSTWPEWFEVARDAFDRLSARHGTVAVAGFSTGGTLALHLAAGRPVARLALLAPFLAVKHYWFLGPRLEVYLETVGRLLERIPRRAPTIADRAVRAEIRRELPFRSFNLHAARSAVELTRLVRAEVPRISTPTLVIQSSRDSVVDPAGARWLEGHLGTPAADRLLLWLERSDHLLALDVEREAVLAAVLDFFGVGRAAPGA
ncbi:alpha/beta hydrolase [Tautonia sociabilis]|uniref:Alpha/beta fold hydrolase n=1 Tax=Tautonia sociabilis TaxID=2080755 RepID=A0A432MMF8_9BACT|nr:alpha/beta fold hydrolase [Tautonia sociabilis]RUL88621.1 alpha/beta fold hydrolase [Tautonia sociabilis]